MTNSFGTQRDEFVRLIVCDKHAVVALQLLIADRRLDAEHVVGIALSSNDVAGLDVAELGVGKAEELGDLPEELFFLRMHLVVGFGDMEETFKHVLEQLAVAPEEGDELFGAGLIAGHVLLGEIEDMGGLLHLCRRHIERLFEGFDLVRGDAAVGFGHLGAKYDHAHGEG